MIKLVFIKASVISSEMIDDEVHTIQFHNKCNMKQRKIRVLNTPNKFAAQTYLELSTELSAEKPTHTASTPSF